jgi:3D (Asp-Asp-Asp) domain-containing protein
MTSLLTAALIGLFVLQGATTATAQAQTAPVEPITPSYTVAMTAYNAVPEQTDGDPHITASGAFSNPEIVAARSIDLADELPFGTVIEITGATSTPGCGIDVVGDTVGYRVIADSMNARMKNKIDILFDTHKTARTFGICKEVQIRVVGKVDIKTMPKSQAELQAQFAKVEKAQTQTLAIFK